jgi:WD40 repeat protein
MDWARDNTNRLAFANNGQLMLWDVANDKLSKHSITSGWIESLSWEDNSSLIVLASSEGVFIWDDKTGQFKTVNNDYASTVNWTYYKSNWIARTREDEAGITIIDTITGEEVSNLRTELFPEEYMEDCIWCKDKSGKVLVGFNWGEITIFAPIEVLSITVEGGKSFLKMNHDEIYEIKNASEERIINRFITNISKTIAIRKMKRS